MEQRQAVGGGEVEGEVTLVGVGARGSASCAPTTDPPCPVTAPVVRMPSMREIDSTWITSAPSAANAPAAMGPAHQAVRSSTRTPASGRSGVPAGSGASHRSGRDRARVLTEPGRRGGRRRIFVVHAPRSARELEGAGRVVDEHAARDEVVAVEDVGTAVHRRHRDAELARPLDDLGRGVVRRPRVHDVVPLVPARLSLRGERELAVGDEIGTFDQHQEVVELIAAVRAEADVAVEGGLHRRCLDRTTRPQRRWRREQRAVELRVAVGRDGHHFGASTRRRARRGRCAAPATLPRPPRHSRRFPPTTRSCVHRLGTARPTVSPVGSGLRCRPAR